MSRLLRPTALVLAAFAVATAVAHGLRAQDWNTELATGSPLAAEPPELTDPHTPRLARRVILIVIDGLGAAEAHLPYLDELRARGAAVTAHVPYPTISRPNYVTILTGVPPRDSGVRTNRVAMPVTVDTVMDRARAARLPVATASDYGTVASLFLRGTTTLHARMFEHANRVLPALPVTWPFDDVRRVDTLDELGPAITDLLAGNAALIPVLVLDVDRAGHASGVGTTYRTAAAAVDRMLRTALAGVDFTRDTVIVTADHGHVPPGGHGGLEPEVSSVAVIAAGAGVVPGATAAGAGLVDVSPTVAALLGVPAPGHAEGRALVELLALSPADAARRQRLDTARAERMLAIADAAQVTSFSALRLAAVLAIGAAAALAARQLRRRGALAVPGLAGIAAGAVAPAVMLLALVAITRGQLSPSYIPPLYRVEILSAIGVTAGVAIQVGLGLRALRGAADRRAAANGLAFAHLGLALGGLGLVRAWLSPPFAIVPSPFWFVALPTLELAAATAGGATAILLLVVWIRRRVEG